MFLLEEGVSQPLLGHLFPLQLVAPGGLAGPRLGFLLLLRAEAVPLRLLLLFPASAGRFLLLLALAARGFLGAVLGCAGLRFALELALVGFPGGLLLLPSLLLGLVPFGALFGGLALPLGLRAGGFSLPVVVRVPP